MSLEIEMARLSMSASIVVAEVWWNEKANSTPNRLIRHQYSNHKNNIKIRCPKSPHDIPPLISRNVVPVLGRH